MLVEEKVSIERVLWITILNQKYLKFKFDGYLSKEIAEGMILQWEGQFSILESGEKVNIIWDCLSMKGYDASSRKIWQQQLSESTDQISKIWILTTNPVFKMAAKTMSLLTKHSLSTAKSELEIMLKESS